MRLCRVVVISPRCGVAIGGGGFLMARRGSLRGAGVAMLCAALLVACSGDGDGDKGQEPSPSGKTPKAVKPATTAELQPLWQTPVTGHITWAWTGQNMLVTQSRDGGLSGVDARTGEKRWTLRMPEGTNGICTMSNQPNEDGIGGVIFAKITKDPEKGVQRDCTTGGAVDIRDGKVLWTHRQGTEEMRAVSVGESVLSLTYWDIGVLHRFDAESGKQLPALGQAENEIDDTFHNGTLVGVGDERRKSFTLYEAETAKRLWSSPPGTELRRIVASDPVTLEVRTDGKISLRTYDKSGEVVHTLVSGRQIHTSAHGFEGDRHPSEHGNTIINRRITPQFVADGALVTHFEDDDTHYAYDLGSGKSRWQLQDEEITLFAVGADALLASVCGDGGNGGDGDGDGRTRLLSISLDQGKQERLGTLVPAQGGGVPCSFASDSERIYALQDDTVVAYRLPAPG